MHFMGVLKAVIAFIVVEEHLKREHLYSHQHFSSNCDVIVVPFFATPFYACVYPSKVCCDTLLLKTFNCHRLEFKFCECRLAHHLNYGIRLHKDVSKPIQQSIAFQD